VSDNDLHYGDDITPYSKLESLDDILAALHAATTKSVSARNSLSATRLTFRFFQFEFVKVTLAVHRLLFSSK
jgi:hypothetical protein